MTTTRYMYVNSTRSSHAVEKVTYTMDGKTFSRNICLCARSASMYSGWSMSFQPTKRLCKECQMILEWREKVMQRKYRLLVSIYSRKGKPWRIAAGAVSSKITFENRVFLVHFSGFGEARFTLQHVESRPNVFECIYDPTQPEPAPMPLFEQAAEG